MKTFREWRSDLALDAGVQIARRSDVSQVRALISAGKNDLTLPACWR